MKLIALTEENWQDKQRKTLNLLAKTKPAKAEAEGTLADPKSYILGYWSLAVKSPAAAIKLAEEWLQATFGKVTVLADGVVSGKYSLVRVCYMEAGGQVWSVSKTRRGVNFGLFLSDQKEANGVIKSWHRKHQGGELKAKALQILTDNLTPDEMRRLSVTVH